MPNIFEPLDMSEQNFGAGPQRAPEQRTTTPGHLQSGLEFIDREQDFQVGQRPPHLQDGLELPQRGSGTMGAQTHSVESSEQRFNPQGL